jgi:hypothetical protein
LFEFVERQPTRRPLAEPAPPEPLQFATILDGTARRDDAQNTPVIRAGRALS